MDNYYKCLGVDENASHDVIKKAFRKLSLKHHPDRGGDASQFKKINEAYQTLGEPDKRKMYDMQRSNPFNGMFGSGNGIDANMNGMPDFIKTMIFGNVGGAGLNRQQSFSMGGMPNVQIFRNGVPININQIRKPSPITKTIEITINQAYTGLKFPFEIERWVQENNTKRVEKEKIYVDIPPGIDHNEIMILRECGNVIDDCRGDIKLFINIFNNSKHLVRRGMDLLYEKNITLKEALCGFTFDIQHINDKTYTINNNTGKIITPMFKKIIPEMGMKRGDRTGNLIINFKIKFPDDLTEEQRKRLEEIL